MAIISPDTFDPLKRYVAVRLQQGVPIVDADWNELEDVRRFELRAYLKWFVGDGIPDGSDGFRCQGAGVVDDFTIRSGAPAVPPGTSAVDHGLRYVGRCIVDGLDVIIAADTGFRAQPLHTSAAGSAALAAALGVPVVPELPSIDGTILVYLDVWERLVTPSEDPDLIFDGLGTEGCARLRREWVVRWRGGSALPLPGDADFLAGHSTCPLARLSRRTSSGVVTAADLVDLRARRLLVPPATLVTDVLGTTTDRYRQGLDRPAISLREAVNALLRGELPSTPDRAVTSDPAVDSIARAFLFDPTGGIVAVWDSNRSGLEQVYTSRLDLADQAAGFGPSVAITSGASPHNRPDAAVLPNGDLAVVYQTDLGQNVLFKRAPLAGLGAAAELPVAATAAAESLPLVRLSGDVLLFAHHASPPDQWHVRRYRHTDDTWLDGAPQVVPVAGPLPASAGHAARDAGGGVWLGFRGAASNVQAIRYLPATNTFTAPTAFDLGGGIDDQPFLLAGAGGDVWLFWRNATVGLGFARFQAGPGWSAAQTVPGSAPNDRQPTAIEDPAGGVWLYFVRGADIFFTRRDPLTGSFSPLRQLLSPGNDGAPHALQGPNRETWLFWNSDRDGNANLYFKQIFTVI